MPLCTLLFGPNDFSDTPSSPCCSFFCSDAPEISVPNRRIGQKLDGEVVLECVIAAVPPASHYWTRDSLPIAMSSKHVTDEYDELDGRVTLRINIRNLQLTDYGDYQCVAGNQFGRTQKTVTLYGNRRHCISHDIVLSFNLTVTLRYTRSVYGIA